MSSPKKNKSQCRVGLSHHSHHPREGSHQPTRPKSARHFMTASSFASHKHASTVRTTEDQLMLLKPTPELLKFYRDKVILFNKENEDMQAKVDQCQSLCDQSFQLEQELQRKNAEYSTLQEAVSELQVCLYQEREQVLRLYAENDKLRIREVEDRKKIELLLSLSGTSESELTYFMHDTKSGISVSQKLPPRLQRFRDRLNVGENNKNRPNVPSTTCQCSTQPQDSDIANLRAQSFSAQLEENIRLFRDQIDSLLKDRELCMKEREVERSRLQNQVVSLSSRLKEVQDALCSTTKDLLTFQEEHRCEEITWMGEKNKITRTLETCQGQMGEVYPPVLGYAVSGSGQVAGSRGNSNCHLVTLKEELRLRDNRVALYQDQCIALEEEMTKLREQTETSRNLFKDRTQKMAGQVTYLKNKYKELDGRRLLEARGFRNEIQLLRNRMRDLEKNICKVSHGTTTSLSQISLASSRKQDQLFSTTQATLEKARRLEHELKLIKNKVVEIEDDLKDSCNCK